MKELKENTPLYPLRFAPIFQYRIWGGRRLGKLLKTSLPGDEPIGEAWILSDREDHSSQVAEGPLQGVTLTELLRRDPAAILGRAAAKYQRFPLLLKFLDAHDVLSVQVHPPDDRKDLIPPGENGKTEAWVVLQADAESRIYAGLQPGTTREDLRRAIAEKTLESRLSWFAPKTEESVLIRAGTVHTLKNVVVFEVQENSDVTFRLYDWDRVEKKTGRHRDLQVEKALACVDFDQTSIGPVPPSIEATLPVLRERVLNCEHFLVWRHQGEASFKVGASGVARVVVGLSGDGRIDREGSFYSFGQGDVALLPASVGECVFRPLGPVTILEIALPQ